MAPAIFGGLTIRLDDLDPALQSRGYFPSSNWKLETGNWSGYARPLSYFGTLPYAQTLVESGIRLIPSRYFRAIVGKRMTHLIQMPWRFSRLR
jgi:hypothetical protein